MLNLIARLSGRAVHKSDTYFNGDDDNNPGKIEEIKQTYRASRQGLVPPDTKSKDEVDKATLVWAAENGWDVPHSTS